MSRADQIFIENFKDVVQNGFSDEQLEVRPRWLDGTPAHTVLYRLPTLQEVGNDAHRGRYVPSDV